MEGLLYKWTNMMKGYQPRWFVLDQGTGLLTYYTSQEKLLKGEQRGCIRMKYALLGIEDEDDTKFTIWVEDKVFHFQAQHLEDRNKWIAALQNCIECMRFFPRRPNRLKHEVTHSRNQNNKTLSLAHFNKKITEADSYLRILMKQLQKLDDKICTASDENKIKLQLVKDHLINVKNSVIYTIFLLQLAHNAKLCSSNETFSNNLTKGDDIPSGMQVPQNDFIASDQTTLDLPNKLNQLELDHSTKSSEKSVMKESPNKLKSTSYESLPPAEALEVSYASSDEEEDFFDAREYYPEYAIDSTAVKETRMTLKNNSSSADATKVGTATDEEIVDYDQIYDSNSDSELDSMESHGSVISHLISQVKIGMDLTKVTLPTFILERRSLLEMYADFFAHADIFVRIPDYSTPQERMIEVVRWYLSAFHAGRKGSVAKKPYNPVLGEVFKCYWNLSDSETNKQCGQGPVPWAKTGDLTFIAEQVSHHPPISAFYAESVDKRIMCSAHIWTKSKFLGLSIGVNNIGLGSIYLLDHNEEYTCTFPSAYGRSILTEPWFEMGGQIEITCQLSGYYAKVDFLTKPFYGNKKHRIHAEVYGPPPTKKLIVTITGEWNGQMYAKWAHNGENELFVDTQTMPIIKKQVSPINKQEEFESRNVWKVVTAALRRQDVNKATTAKCDIEQNQRNLVKEREEKSIKWQNRAFHFSADKWQYNNPLTARLDTSPQSTSLAREPS